MSQIERVAKAICANEIGGFCQNIGGDLGCKVGRGEPPHWSKCIANTAQLYLSGRIQTAEAAIEAAKGTKEYGARELEIARRAYPNPIEPIETIPSRGGIRRRILDRLVNDGKLIKKGRAYYALAKD